jgi:hypothetical protein
MDELRLNTMPIPLGKRWYRYVLSDIILLLVFNKLIVFYVLYTAWQSYAFFWKDTEISLKE